MKLVVFLTMPPDKGSNDIPLQQQYLRGFKAALLEGNVLPAIFCLMDEPVEKLEL